MKKILLAIGLIQVGLSIYLIKKIKTVMKTQADFLAVISRIDAATTAEAQKLKDLKDQIAGLGLASDVEEEIFNKLDASATRLEGIGVDVENPVPADTTGGSTTEETTSETSEETGAAGGPTSTDNG